MLPIIDAAEASTTFKWQPRTYFFKEKGCYDECQENFCLGFDSHNPHRKDDDVKTYSVKYVDDYANHYAYPQYTAVSASKSSYYGSYKTVQYIQYAQSSTRSFYRIETVDNTGYTQSVLTESTAVSDRVARRAHITNLYYTSDVTSSIIETFKAYITKEGIEKSVNEYISLE